MMKKIICGILTLVFFIALLPNYAFAESSNAEGADFISRSDGVWLFPLDAEYYNHFSDWAGCLGGDSRCSVCGKDHPGWGDGWHTRQQGHNGFDISVPEGNSVMAAAEGNIIVACNDEYRGNTIVIEHKIANTDYSYYSYYQHLRDFVLSSGPVSAGDLIAYTGATGAGSGAHFHFGIVRGASGRSGLGLLKELEDKGWILDSDKQEGRILNNPAFNSPAGFPTGDLAVVPPLKAHAGSVMYTFDKTEVAINPSYLSLCHFYPSYMEVTVNNVKTDSYIWTLPCIDQTVSRSEIIRAPKMNETFIVTGICENSVKGHYWYRINVNGKTGYIFPTVVESGDYIYDDVKISGVSIPTKLNVGDRFSLCGTIETKYNKIKSLNAEITRTSDSKKMCSWAKDINANSYSILNSELDMAMRFNELPSGEYRLTIWADVPSYYSNKGNDLQQGGVCMTLVETWFTVE